MKLYTCRILPLFLLGCTAFSPQLPPPASDNIPTQRTSEKRAAPKSAPTASIDESQSLLKQAAKCLDAGDEPAALPLLTAYIEAHPDHATVRAHLAELLLRLHQPDDAKYHLSRYVADAQEQGEPIDQHLVHAETRLVEIAIGQSDAYSERLHRGIGLYLLAERVAKAEDSDEDFVEKTMFQAIAELKDACRENPTEARPHWYLFLAWSQLGQRLPADTHLLRARALAAGGGLTPSEGHALTVAQ